MEARRGDDARQFAVAAGGKIKRLVKDEYAALQQHVKRVGGFESAERVYAAPLDSDGVLLPKRMKVHNIEWVADGAARFIQDQGASSTKPFFLYIGWTLPHGPDADRSMRDASLPFTPAGTWKVNAKFVSSTSATRKEVRTRVATLTSSSTAEARQGHKDYGLALSWLDRGVGTVLWALQRRGVAYRTLTVFTSDHGSVDKGHCFSRGTQAPLLMQWPAFIKPGGSVTQPVSLLDLAATLLHAAVDPANATLFAAPADGSTAALPTTGLPSAGAPPLHGASMLSLMPSHHVAHASPSVAATDVASERKLVCESGHSRSLLTGSFRYLYVPQSKHGNTEAYGAAARHPGIHAVEQLYDVREDPGEERNLIDKYQLLGSASELPPLTGRAEVRAARAFEAFRRSMKSDLMNLASTCGV